MELLGIGRSLEDLRASLRQKYEGELLRDQERRRAEGVYMYEGKFRSLAEIEQLQRSLRRVDRRLFVEIVLLLLSLAALSALVLRVLKFFLPQG